MMDSRMLKEGQEFSELRDSYMVFTIQQKTFIIQNWLKA